MIDNSKEYVICAAIWYKDGEEYPRGMFAQNLKTGEVIGQWRHGNCIAVLPTNPKYNGGIESVQGFLTSKGNFVDRWQGMQIAHDAGQVSDEVALNPKWDGKNANYFDSGDSLRAEPDDFMGHRDKAKEKYNMLFSEDLY